MLDGEVVAYQGDQTSFTRLQQRLGASTPSAELVATYPVVYCVFDVLELDGEDLTDRPLAERRARLTGTLRQSSALQLSEAWRDDSQGRFAAACRSGWEGLIAKTRRHANRRRSLEGVVEAEVRLGAGVRHRRLHRTRWQPVDFGALLVGYYEQGSLRYAGKVGTGYTKATLHDLGLRLRQLETAAPAFVDVRPIPRGAHWTRPALVAQIGFAEWTSDARLRPPPLSRAPRRQEPERGRAGTAPMSAGGVFVHHHHTQELGLEDDHRLERR